MENINLNLIPCPTSPVCHLSQNDAGRFIRANLFDGAEVLTLSGSEIVRVRYKKPDGSHGSAVLTNTADNYIDIITPEDLATVAGVVYCKLKIGNIGARSFLIKVEPKA